MYDTRAPLVRRMDAEEKIRAVAEYVRDVPMFGGHPPLTVRARFTWHGRVERRRVRRRLFALRDVAEVLDAARLMVGMVKDRPGDTRLLQRLEEAVADLAYVRVPALAATAPPPRPAPPAEVAPDDTRSNSEGLPA